jgi:uncharacterized sulfatase
MIAAAAIAMMNTQADKPNILWISSEDNGPHLGCYGDDYADTPNLDALAAKGMMYDVCWSNAPVCAPARTTIISGLYANSTGSHHMRSFTELPAGFQMFPQILREAGYFTTNHTKEDYNLDKPGKVWDQSSRQAHWRNRSEGQPFFTVFNLTVSHESQLRRRPHKAIHDPDKAVLPPYFPDVPEVRQDWAQYYDKITEMDTQAGRRLKELADDGLTEDTIIFYWGDHGSGMPRHKRMPYNTGFHVPLIVYVPEKHRDLVGEAYEPGATDRLVSFVDFGPTVLSLAGLDAPAFYQGSAFLGPKAEAERDYMYGFRGRMDERYDCARTVGDGRFVYVRNFMPHLSHGEHNNYMFITPTTRVWRELFEARALNSVQSAYWEPRPAEELFDLEADPHETRNLANQPGYEETLERMRGALRDWQLEIRDVGMIPEAQFQSRKGLGTPYELARNVPLEEILDIANIAASRSIANLEDLTAASTHEDPAIRYWAATGFHVRGERTVLWAADHLRRMMDDPDPTVKIAAADAVAEHGSDEDLATALKVLLSAADLNTHSLYTVMQAINAVDRAGDRSQPIWAAVLAHPHAVDELHPRMNKNVEKLMEAIQDRVDQAGG